MRLERFRAGMSPDQHAQIDQKKCEAIEAQFQSLQDQISAIQTAQSTATAAARESARISSYPNPGLNIVTAAESGGSVTITIASHTRVYPVQGTIDVPDVAITGGTLPGLLPSTRYYVYYDDTTLSVTNPTFVSTTTGAAAQVGAAAGRHFVGYVDTPASGSGGSASGSGGSTPGGGGGYGAGGGVLQ